MISHYAKMQGLEVPPDSSGYRRIPAAASGWWFMCKQTDGLQCAIAAGSAWHLRDYSLRKSPYNFSVCAAAATPFSKGEIGESFLLGRERVISFRRRVESYLFWESGVMSFGKNRELSLWESGASSFSGDSLIPLARERAIDSSPGTSFLLVGDRVAS